MNINRQFLVATRRNKQTREGPTFFSQLQSCADFSNDETSFIDPETSIDFERRILEELHFRREAQQYCQIGDIEWNEIENYFAKLKVNRDLNVGIYLNHYLDFGFTKRLSKLLQQAHNLIDFDGDTIYAAT